MTQLGLRTLAAALLLLVAGAAGAQQPALAAKGCCSGSSCCQQATCPAAYTGTKASAAGCCAAGSCRSKTGTSAADCPCCTGGCGAQAAAGTSFCAANDKGCPCCQGTCSCAKADTGSSCCCKAEKGSTCSCKAEKCSCCGSECKCCNCGKKSATRATAGCPCCGQARCAACGYGAKSETTAKGKRTVLIVVMPMGPPPLPPMPFPAPPLAFAEPILPPTSATPVPAWSAPPPAPLPPPAVTVGNSRPIEPAHPAIRVVAPPAPALAMAPCCTGQCARAELHCCNLRVVHEDGTDAIEICHGASTRLTCNHLTLKLAGHKTVKVAASGNQVAIDSPCLKAQADHVALSGSEDHLILEGHVRLSYHLNENESGSVTAGRVVVNLAQGNLEIQAATHISTQPTKAVVPASLEYELNFWNGMSR